LTYWSRGGASAAITAVGSAHPVPMPGPGFGDVQSGALLAGGIAAGLFQRDRSGKGVVVDSSLLASGMWAMQPSMVASSLVGADTLHVAPHDQIGNPLANTYRTLDGRHITLGLFESDRYWEKFCEACEMPELVSDERFITSTTRAEHRESLTALLDSVFSQRHLKEWQILLGRQTGPWTVVQYPSEVAQDRQAEANGFVQDVDYEGGKTLRMVTSPVQFDGSSGQLSPAPNHGANTEEVLEELGFDWDLIILLKDKGAII
jgi:crotonobetainyl-CoA:carnitine CoA-transferase CaiB-like acyl-CoA transferase